MSTWGENEPGIEAEPAPAEEQPAAVDEKPAKPSERRTPGHAFGIDLAELTSDLVSVAFHKEIRKQVSASASKAAEAAVGGLLDAELLDDLRIRVETAATDAAAAQLAAINDEPQDEEEPEPALYYGSVDEFVREYLIGAYRRRVDGQNRVWAARWWEYDEAVIRLDALWRAWEKLRQDPSTGMSVWWRDHADHHMIMLFSPDGPFAGVKESEENRNKKGEPLPYAAPPDGLFPDERLPSDEEPQTAS
ncbi:DUF4913 domain-containing protein [Pseudoclavibacter helvolus]|uniref:DUF4913 domain-containing protein n=1 Tax=Pseudoclavibacter helvolus TaxID=255205 RepID=UPI0009E8EF80|nr:DUF4913 domain-containing protein [Pseudoclavibacter helvolus]